MVIVAVPMYAAIAAIDSFFKVLCRGVLPDALRRSGTRCSRELPSLETGSILKSVALVRRASSYVKFYQNKSQ
jgi:hypothetical protein